MPERLNNRDLKFAFLMFGACVSSQQQAGAEGHSPRPRGKMLPCPAARPQLTLVSCWPGTRARLEPLEREAVKDKPSHCLGPHSVHLGQPEVKSLYEREPTEDYTPCPAADMLTLLSWARFHQAESWAQACRHPSRRPVALASWEGSPRGKATAKAPLWKVNAPCLLLGWLPLVSKVLLVSTGDEEC